MKCSKAYSLIKTKLSVFKDRQIHYCIYIYVCISIYLYIYIYIYVYTHTHIYTYMKVKVLVALFYPTLCNPMDCNLPVFSVYVIFQARILEWVAISFSVGSS